MADKKTKKAVKKTNARPIKKVATATKKVDIVEEAKKELKKMEAQQTQETENKKAGGKFAWGTFIGGVLLTVAAMVLGGLIRDQIRINSINKFLPELVNGLGGGMEVEQLGKLTDHSGLFSFTIKFTDYDDEFTSAITKDGKYFFTDSGYVVADLMEELAGAETTNAETATVTCDGITKVDEPNLTVYVSSDCGHCKQAEAAMAEAVANNPDLADKIHLRYAGTINDDGEVVSFLGSTESGTENLRQVCIREQNAAAYWDYVGCMADGGETSACQTEAGVNATVVNNCMEDGTGLAAITADQEAATNHAVQGTPSFYVNDTQSVSESDFGGRAAAAYQQMICCASATPGEYCESTIVE